jgi:hypothetical protein
LETVTTEVAGAAGFSSLGATGSACAWRELNIRPWEHTSTRRYPREIDLLGLLLFLARVAEKVIIIP